MIRKLPAASIAALFAAVLVAVGASSANAQSKQQRYDRDGRPNYGANGPNRVYQQGRTRAHVTTRSLAGRRHRSAAGRPQVHGLRFSVAVRVPNVRARKQQSPIDRQPLNPPSDLGGQPTQIPLY